MWITAILYVSGRTFGKILGAHLGARLSKAASQVRKYLGLCLFSQAGVAIGLAILASQTFEEYPEVASAVVGVVTATTFLVQIIGPSSVKFAVTKAGEVGRNVTEEDLMETYTVRDVMDANPPTIKHNTTLPRILEAIAEGDSIYFPVVADNGELVGIITMLDLKNILTMTSLGDLIVAWDIMHPVEDRVKPEEPLKETVQTMRDRQLDYLAVVDEEKLVGFLESRRIDRFLGNEIIRRRKEAARQTGLEG
jgi:CBS domain-containing protein